MPIAYIEHQIPGRLRLRIPERRGDVAFFQRVVEALSKLTDIKELDGSSLTGSVRIRHSGTAEAIAAAASKEGLFEIGKRDGGAQPKKPPKEPASPGDAGMLDSIATGLSGLALFQVTQGQVTGSAGENFWNAYGAQRLLGRSEVAAGFFLFGLFLLLHRQLLCSATPPFFFPPSAPPPPPPPPGPACTARPY